ncbi:siderophore-interacting protein [Spirosoma endophyticum]|uniref:Siderophore-interacting FAD-binding domain-containing protein n=1 Tax=Spirosoma endophyticum TaxID=662367 RepID=A0A1I1LU14_9BACT|nr:siderophore-interacting protein [Spirosoma endophyticum]SFC75972.1 Siderophore-interacting FAD-binding domain-containing protein [Spirosoma endophyticum]
MANIIKRAAFKLMEKTLAEQANVLAIRTWNPGSMYEIDLYLPTVNMGKWTTIPRLKCKVDEFEYRDYTPAWWEAEKGICTLFVETGHNGAGSRWAQRVQPGDELMVGPAHAAPLPSKKGKVLGLVDGSALGHMLGLKQLTDPGEHPLEVGVFLHEDYQLPNALSLDNPEFEFILEPERSSLDSLENWTRTKDLSEYSSVYIAGYIPMVRELRKKLKSRVPQNTTFYAHGFWR